MTQFGKAHLAAVLFCLYGLCVVVASPMDHNDYHLETSPHASTPRLRLRSAGKRSCSRSLAGGSASRTPRAQVRHSLYEDSSIPYGTDSQSSHALNDHPPINEFTTMNLSDRNEGGSGSSGTSSRHRRQRQSQSSPDRSQPSDEERTLEPSDLVWGHRTNNERSTLEIFVNKRRGIPLKQARAELQKHLTVYLEERLLGFDPNYSEAALDILFPGTSIPDWMRDLDESECDTLVCKIAIALHLKKDEVRHMLLVTGIDAETARTMWKSSKESWTRKELRERMEPYLEMHMRYLAETSEAGR
ncbi:hypothetical protein CBS101457_000245 [Exobasidium rhododendri]|nr:hypothetical protein CBS101457_000245 [Exobasidium rhododendri]